MAESDSRSARFAESDDDVFAEGTVLTSDRAAVLDRIAAGDDLDEDDRANLDGLVDALKDDLRRADWDDPDDRAVSADLVGCLDSFRGADGSDAAGTLSETLYVLADAVPAYEAGPIQGLAFRLGRRAVAAEVGAADEEFASVSADPAGLLAERGYGPRVAGLVTDIVTAPYRDIGRLRDRISGIDRVEELSSADPDNSSFHARLVNAHLARYQVERDLAGSPLADESFERLKFHLAEIDPADLGPVSLEDTVKGLASYPDTRDLGRFIVPLARHAATLLDGMSAKFEAVAEAADPDDLLPSYGAGPGHVALGSHYVERGLVMSGVAASYGAPADAEAPLLDYVHSGRTARWDQGNLV